jgi:hypothetical protein
LTARGGSATIRGITVEIRRWFPRLTSTTVSLAVGITLAVIGASTAGAYLYSVRQSRTLLAAARETAVAQGELIAPGSSTDDGERPQLIGRIETFGRSRRSSTSCSWTGLAW